MLFLKHLAMKLEVGQKFEVTFKYNQEQVNTFIKITGDDNPIHYDEAYAANTIFKKPIIHGVLSASIFSKIFGTEFPGEGTIYISQNLIFLRPMYVEENYTATAELVEIVNGKHRGRFEVKVLNAAGKTTIEGETLLYHRNKL